VITAAVVGSASKTKPMCHAWPLRPESTLTLRCLAQSRCNSEAIGPPGAGFLIEKVRQSTKSAPVDVAISSSGPLGRNLGKA